MIDNNTVMDEFLKVWAKPVLSEFELQINKEIDDWINEQLTEKFWTTPEEAAEGYWAERLK
jgi:Na+/H+ antiporter NhaA